MGITEILLLAVGLSMDAFSVSLCKGLKMPKLNMRHGFIIALFFGFFQGAMPIIGWLLAVSFANYVTLVDHWIAFVLLAYIGGKMAYESFKSDDDEEHCDRNCSVCSRTNCNILKLDYKELFVLAIATSIDALAVGITFAFTPNMPTMRVFGASGLIAITTFAFSIVGVAIGNRFGVRYKSKAELVGGLILIGLGIKILLEGLCGN